VPKDATRVSSISVPSAEPPGGSPTEESAPGRAGFRQVGEDVAFEGFLLSVVQGRFLAPDDRPFKRDIIRHPGAVAIVPVTEDGEVVLLHQYRGAVDRWIFEIPAGTRDVDGEPTEGTAARELAEEAGYAADRLTLLAVILNSPGFCDEATWIYLATGLRAVPPARDGFEEHYLSVVEVPFDQFDAMVDDGSIADAQTILGVGLARRRLAASGDTPP
jgi:8-oxo-dGTP pyrophosphatase MutT (NUDIX family)